MRSFYTKGQYKVTKFFLYAILISHRGARLYEKTYIHIIIENCYLNKTNPLVISGLNDD